MTLLEFVTELSLPEERTKDLAFRKYHTPPLSKARLEAIIALRAREVLAELEAAQNAEKATL